MKFLAFTLLVLIVCGNLSSPTWAQDTTRQLAIIVHKANPTSDLPLESLRKIFLGEQAHWAHGGPILTVMRDPGQPEREAILRQILKMTERDYNRYLLQATFTGTIKSPPKSFATVTGVLRFVSSIQGAVGCSRTNELNESVKALRINGHLPGEPGYPLSIPGP